jgi:hypothetical protein
MFYGRPMLYVVVPISAMKLRQFSMLIMFDNFANQLRKHAMYTVVIFALLLRLLTVKHSSVNSLCIRHQADSCMLSEHCIHVMLTAHSDLIVLRVQNTGK